MSASHAQQAPDAIRGEGPSSIPTGNPLNVAVVILNFNGPAMTLRCLQALFHLKGGVPHLLVCDNHSTDDSVGQIRQFLLEKAEKTPSAFDFCALKSSDISRFQVSQSPKSQLALIESSQNLGFAGGMNLGVRLAEKIPGIDFIWILNNDTVVDPGALWALLAEFQANQRLGVLGSALCYLDQPETLQAVGGRYDPWLGRTRHVLHGASYPAALSQGLHAEPIDYAVGASICFRQEVLKAVGYLSEDYFLYFEEIDWAERFRRLKTPWHLGYALKSRVYHQEGGTTGANEKVAKETTRVADYFFQTSRLRFARRFYPRTYPLVHLTQLGVALNRLRRGQLDLAILAFRLFWGLDPGPPRR